MTEHIINENCASNAITKPHLGVIIIIIFIIKADIFIRNKKKTWA